MAGLAGPRREVLALARSLVGQAVVASSPRRLRVVVLTPAGDPDGDWAWAAWLPHASGHLPSAAAGHDPDDDHVAGPRVLLVLDGAARLRRDPRVAALLASAGEQTLALCLDDDPAHLPAECGAAVEVFATGDDPGAVLSTRGGTPQPLCPDLVSPAWAERLARDLARLADATPAGPDATLPAQVRLLDLLASTGSQVVAPGPGGAGFLLPPTADIRALTAAWARRRATRERATTPSSA